MTPTETTGAEPGRVSTKARDRFVDTVLADLKGGMVMLMVHVGDRLGLFRALAESSRTSDELAAATATQERYVREWLAAVTCAGYVEYDATTGRYVLPEAHSPVLVEDDSPVFLCGLNQEMPALWRVMPSLMERFRNGGGLSIDDYDRDWWDGMERFTATWFENFLLQEWIPNAPGVAHTLERGAHVADVGCGRGRALIKLARAFPKLTAVGYDLSDVNLEGAKGEAREAGVADRVSFRKHDVHEGLPERYDLVLTFDAAHDFKDPRRAFRAIHDALADDGRYLVLEFRVGETLEENVGPVGAMFYAWSVAYCMTTSLGMGGTGLGTCGLPEATVRGLARDAGFARLEVVPFDNPFNTLYLASKGAAA